MTIIWPLLSTLGALTGPPAIILAAGLATMATLIGVAVLIPAAKQRMTVAINAGKPDERP